MAISNRDRIGKTLDILRDGLLPFLSSQFDEKLGSNWKSELPYNFKNCWC